MVKCDHLEDPRGSGRRLQLVSLVLTHMRDQLTFLCSGFVIIKCSEAFLGHCQLLRHFQTAQLTSLTPMPAQ